MFIVFFPAFFSFYQIYYFLAVYKHDSPAWLLKQGREEDAKEALRFVYTEKGVDVGLARLKGQKTENNEIQEPLLSAPEASYKNVFCSDYFKRMLRIATILNIGQQFSGNMVIFLYSTSIFEDMGGGKFVAKVLTVAMGILGLLAALAAIPLLGKFGRKPLLVFGQIFIILNLFTLGASTSILSLDIVFRAFLIYTHDVFFSLSLGGVFWAYIGEVCNEKCISIGLSLNIMNVVILSFVFPVITDYYGISTSFYGMTFLSFLLLVYELIDLFETKGLTKQEILRKLQSNNKVNAE